ncbi:alpha-L-fucosidase-like [Acanthaster planci]|uniref:alpha-L-fucosidase n=1 Tax=Acanthaster planci TaxID=133434 RepID=A0A8B7XHR9_ACAPL|nr:alpha-L-fucosidase-like [Acanthaster planci]
MPALGVSTARRDCVYAVPPLGGPKPLEPVLPPVGLGPAMSDDLGLDVPTAVAGVQARNEPNWESLDARPLPSSYDEAKIGVFSHWGVYSVPSYGSEWFWWNWQALCYPGYVKFMQKTRPSGFTYQDFAAEFKVELFDTEQFTDILQASGANYFVLTSNHHEGFTDWPSKYSWNWNSMDVGPKRDLVGEVAAAVRSKTNLRFGLYHSQFEWFNPLYIQDLKHLFTTNDYVTKVYMPELMELVETYRPELVWSDGSGEGVYQYWKSTEFLAWLYNDSPVKDSVVVNVRWGILCECNHGGYYTCQDRYNPGVLQKHKFENAMTLDLSSLGYRRDATLKDIMDIDVLIATLAQTVSCGGNLLVNVGPTRDGRIVPIFEERLRQMGAWLKVNGEAIYSSKPWKAQKDVKTESVWYTSKQNETVTAVYVIVLDWPIDNDIILGSTMPTNRTTVSVLGHEGALKWTRGPSGEGMTVTLPILNPTQMPCHWAWVLKIQNLK